MRVIYCIENKVNHKRYIGQTNNFAKRKAGHKSVSTNPKSHSYNLPLYNAIRKYGWENFEFTVLEEIGDDESQFFVDERERFFITYYQTLVEQNGYNVNRGGKDGDRKKLSFEQKVGMSKLFSLSEVVDIQNMLVEGILTRSILKKYEGKLSKSMLYNINSGLAFKNEKLQYPLYSYKNGCITPFHNLNEIHQIKNDIISGMYYKKISEKWDISLATISLVNNGKLWHEENYTYPLAVKSHSRIHNVNTWVKDVKQDLMKSTLNLKEIAEKYNKAYSTIKKINNGHSHRDRNLTYPLTSNRP